jgi:hypothetical protein
MRTRFRSVAAMIAVVAFAVTAAHTVAARPQAAQDA